MKETLTILSVCVLILFLIYIGSRLQMRAWLHEIDLALGNKFVNYINSKHVKKDGKETEK